MLQSSRRWLKRNRTPFAIGAGVLGAGYMVGQYVLGKLGDARARMGEERVARENLRRRFEQNQQDCTFTVLAILPTATENILDAIPVERVLEELQRQKAERLSRSVGPSEIASSAPPSVVDGGDDDARSSSMQTESYIHASQVVTEGDDGTPGNAEVPEERKSRKSTKSKAQLWNEMKITSITRAFTLLYTLSLLTLLTRIQLNLLGRRNYLASVVSLAAPQEASKINLENHDDDGFEHAYGNDFETNRRYLSLSWWLLHRGCIELIEKVQAAVTEVFGLLNPREEISLEKLSELTLEVRKRVEGATEAERRTSKWLRYLLPSADQEDFVLRESGMTEPTSPTTTSSLRRLIDETSDLVDSPAFSHVLTLLLDAAFSHLIDVKISSLSYKIPPVSESTARIQELVGDGAKAKVASSLAVFCRQAHGIGSGANNEYLQAVESVGALEAFAAVVYSSNFEFESPEVVVETRALMTLEGPESVMVGNVGLVQGEREGGSRGVTLGGDDGFESAWGKAVAKEDDGLVY
ncbi:Peroxin-3 [Dothidotthia symphoricarpi CBS 119687]|uniref:Peroxin-3 n=1 Tax=Dothidotthia symphoricarpi CBS 119687 TaxID=1392245 RepID=A0A6A6AA54_9PLEO|nr:Peroxin-3 [Dothidotthia symphoricarpi CBS 119687]KAF2128700.1 Peroxin-3 [Dothidotthia symphoricarpi CBS 119687]